MHEPTKAVFHLLVLAGVILGTACGGRKQAEHPVATLAPTELDCPREDVVYRNVSDEKIEARGCGRMAVYVEECDRQFNAATSATLGMPASSESCRWARKSLTKAP